jgi:hypothetical protein
MRRIWKAKGLGVLAVVLVGLLLTTGIVQADLKADKVVYAWDVVSEKYENGNLNLQFNVWVPFWHELTFDTDPFDWQNFFPFPDQNGVPMDYPGGCTGTDQTVWEGVMEYGLYHVDDAPLGALGFMTSRDWELVHCDRDGTYTPKNKILDNADLAWPPPSDRTTILTDGQILGDFLGGWNVLDANAVVPCTTGNCESEIITTIFVSLDMDCDGQVDPLRAGRGYTVDNDGNIDWAAVCFFAEALSPPPDTPLWSGNIQARVGAVGESGDKTVNFSLGVGGTAVSLSSFKARWAEGAAQPVILWAAIAVVGVGTLGALIWRLRPVRR